MSDDINGHSMYDRMVYTDIFYMTVCINERNTYKNVINGLGYLDK